MNKLKQRIEKLENARGVRGIVVYTRLASGALAEGTVLDDASQENVRIVSDDEVAARKREGYVIFVVEYDDARDALDSKPE